MLSFLQIENIAIIEKMSVSFADGLNILTGETGAGKSILIDSINAVSGAKTSRELIRTGADSAFVAAVFAGASAMAPMLSEMGIPPAEDGEVQLQRRLYRDGKNACFVNGTPVTVAMLRQLADRLVNIHGQRDSQALLRSENHLGFLDRFAGNRETLDAYAESYGALTALKKEMDALDMDEGYKARRLDLLRFQVGELEAAGLEDGEADALRKRRAVLKNAARVTAALSRALSALLGSDDAPGADALLEDAVGNVGEAADVAHGLQAVLEKLTEARETVLDASSVLDDALSQLGGGENEIDAVEERLDLVTRMSRKYGGSEASALAFLEKARTELDDITFSEERLAALRTEYDKRLAKTKAIAQTLTAQRIEAGRRLSAAVERELAELDMPHVRFFARIEAAPLGENGADAAEFLITANPGEEPKPLVKVASGGELSRVMLALQTILNAGGDATLIFDEIDTGVSGSAAGRIAVRLKNLSRENQVLCITHSAQIAAYAAEHKFLYKTVENGMTFTRLRTLTGEERARELARITFGESFTEIQLASARSLLQTAREKQ